MSGAQGSSWNLGSATVPADATKLLGWVGGGRLGRRWGGGRWGGGEVGWGGGGVGGGKRWVFSNRNEQSGEGVFTPCAPLFFQGWATFRWRGLLPRESLGVMFGWKQSGGRGFFWKRVSLPL